LECIVWSGSGSGDGTMEVTHIKSLKDTVKMGCHDSYPLTPTHMAIQYSSNMIRAMPGRKKLLIIITDGYPQAVKNNTEIPIDVLCQMAHKEMLKALRRCPNIVGMLITPSSRAKDCCRTIFGKRFLVVENMNEGAKVITKQFQKLVAGVLGR
jgi:Mg-chelatase subunit ChlD